MDQERTKIAFKFLVSILFWMSASAWAQNSIGNSLDTNVELRGQGRASLCYDFAEEQLLKDYTCHENCSLNADDWKFSIFDIARAHQQKWIKDQGRNSIKADLSVDLLSNGASDVFPFQELGIESVRSSSCTLEKEIFFLNRSKLTNPDRLQLGDFIIDLYAKLRAGAPFSMPESNVLKLRSSMKTLGALARRASDAGLFLTSVINYTKCQDRIAIPAFQHQSKTTSDTSKIQALVELLLRQKKSLYVGVCAEILVAERDDGSPCGRHAVVLKNIRKTCVQDEDCHLEIQVVDSAFFSLRTPNRDGSTWIPESIVVSSIAKSSKNFEQILEKTKRESESAFNEFGIQLRDFLVMQLQNISRDDFKKSTLDVLKSFSLKYSDASSKKLYASVRAEVEKLQLNSLSDLNQIPEAVSKAVQSIYNHSLNGMPGNGIVWIN